MKPVARIEQAGRYFDLYADGRITQAGCRPSGDWYCTGAVRINNFGRMVENFTLAEVLSGKLAWRHKNGSQRIHLCDLDHGHNRMWGHPRHEVFGL